jgi:MoaA/NifB/PqqE/SkfB family radical SAM enzyme
MEQTISSQRLEDIGFYTLSDDRALNSSKTSPLWRCEMLLTDACNFKCPYCRGMREDCVGFVPIKEASECLSIWIKEGLKNVRFSGGEPTLYKHLSALVKQAKEGGVERIAISTNGSASRERYEELIDAGVNDFSISLDGCCSSVGEEMSGGIKGAWEKVVENIKWLSKATYVTVGMVFTENNVEDCINAVLFADSLVVSDIRVIPSAQYNKALLKLSDLPQNVLDKYPILRYRINNLKEGKHVRGIGKEDCKTCYLGLDDMAVAGGKHGLKHFPCIIHLREGGDPIGNVGPNMRQEREDWVKNHDSFADPICRSNCLDVCVQYNQTASERERS